MELLRNFARIALMFLKIHGLMGLLKPTQTRKTKDKTMTNQQKPLTKKQTEKRDAILLEIAKEELFLETLEDQRSDRLDFHEHGVLSIRDALRKAYEAGRQSVK